MGHQRVVDGEALYASYWNDVMDALETQGVKVLGRGILDDSGFQLTAGADFTLEVSAGWVNILITKQIGAFEYELPPSVTRYVWIDDEGAVTLTTDTTYPGGDVVCLGKVVTDGSGITDVTEEGRMLAWNWRDERTLSFGQDALVLDNLNGRVGVGMVPTTELESAHPLQGPGLSLVEQTVDPAGAAGALKVYAKEVGSFAELFIRHENAGVKQLTSAGLIVASALPANLASIAALAGAADKAMYFTGAGTVVLFDLTAAGRAILDDASATAQRTTLGLGTVAVLNTNGNASHVLKGDGSFGTVPGLPTSSFYLPTVTNETNLDSVSISSCNYYQVGSVVVVTGEITVDPTAAGLVQAGISLPVASNFGATYDCSGVAFAPGVAGQGAAIYSDAANNRARLEFIAVDTTSKVMSFMFSYQVI